MYLLSAAVCASSSPAPFSTLQFGISFFILLWQIPATAEKDVGEENGAQQQHNTQTWRHKTNVIKSAIVLAFQSFHLINHQDRLFLGAIGLEYRFRRLNARTIHIHVCFCVCVLLLSIFCFILFRFSSIFFLSSD